MATVAGVRPSVLALLVAMAGCAPDGVALGRPYGLGVPVSADATTPLPLLVVLHGYGANAQLEDVLLAFSKEVGARGFLYAEPEGTLDKSGKRFWNATDACCNYDGLKVDDVGFLRALVEDVGRHHPVDPKRVFLVGHSNGGFLALRAACEASDVFSGVVSLAGAAWLDRTRCPAGPPVSVLLVHGTADEVIGYTGGATSLGAYPSARESLETFAGRGGCVGPRVGLGTSDFVGDAQEETRREAVGDCRAGARAELWSLEGAGHIPVVNARWRGAVLDWLLDAR
jgi:polyhydroxybutyrate depolymerase